ncbi:aldo/keto reductase [Agromyces albus]|uniref:aldo/keto reductase n=1 Tax=Agromyces albus TaxID=205332 RepID=UPI0027837271|nr:aldo/keto reductase [Agromyces albus]MDQ0576740.1 D-threo-aldose 1-dehydrogenase [Agromyces albus]
MTKQPARPGDDEWIREYGSTGIRVSALCLGTSSWVRAGEDEPTALRRIADLAVATAESPINFVDTSNIYGGGVSEQLIGDLFRNEIWDDSIVLQTKVDRDVPTGDFSGEQMWRSLEQSLERLGVDRVPVLFIHDPENTTFEAATEDGGPVEALVEMKRQGLAENIGVSGGPADLMLQFVETGVFDTLINHNRMTLLDRSADQLYDEAARRGMGITNAAPYGAGILTDDPRFAHSYAYGPAAPEVIRSADRMREICREAGIPLAAAALQYSMRDERIHSTVVGISDVERLHATLELVDVHITEETWAALAAERPPLEVWQG